MKNLECKKVNTSFNGICKYIVLIMSFIFIGVIGSNKVEAAFQTTFTDNGSDYNKRFDFSDEGKRESKDWNASSLEVGFVYDDYIEEGTISSSKATLNTLVQSDTSLFSNSSSYYYAFTQASGVTMTYTEIDHCTDKKSLLVYRYDYNLSYQASSAYSNSTTFTLSAGIYAIIAKGPITCEWKLVGGETAGEEVKSAYIFIYVYDSKSTTKSTVSGPSGNIESLSLSYSISSPTAAIRDIVIYATTDSGASVTCYTNDIPFFTASVNQTTSFTANCSVYADTTTIIVDVNRFDDSVDRNTFSVAYSVAPTLSINSYVGTVQGSGTSSVYYSQPSTTVSITWRDAASSLQNLTTLTSSGTYQYYRYKWCTTSSTSVWINDPSVCLTSTFQAIDDINGRKSQARVYGRVSTPSTTGTWYLWVEGGVTNGAGLYVANSTNINGVSTNSSSYRIFKYVIDNTAPTIRNFYLYGDNADYSYTNVLGANVYALTSGSDRLDYRIYYEATKTILVTYDEYMMGYYDTYTCVLAENGEDYYCSYPVTINAYERQTTSPNGGYITIDDSIDYSSFTTWTFVLAVRDYAHNTKTYSTTLTYDSVAPMVSIDSTGSDSINYYDEDQTHYTTASNEFNITIYEIETYLNSNSMYYKWCEYEVHSACSDIEETYYSIDRNSSEEVYMTLTAPSTESIMYLYLYGDALYDCAGNYYTTDRDLAENSRFSTSYRILKFVVDSSAPSVESFVVKSKLLNGVEGYTNSTSVYLSLTGISDTYSTMMIIKFYQVVSSSNVLIHSKTSTLSSTYGATVTLNQATDGTTYELIAQVCDPLLNCTTKKTSVTIDKTAPTISSFYLKGEAAIANNYTNSTSVNVTIKASDANNTLYYKVEKKGAVLWGDIYKKSATMPTSLTLEDLTDGESYQIKLTVYDIIGNTSTKTITLYYDTTAPTMSGSIGNIKGGGCTNWRIYK